jgi:hypothetical protein
MCPISAVAAQKKLKVGNTPNNRHFSFAVALQPKSGLGSLVFRFPDHTKLDIYTRKDSNELMITSRGGCHLHNTQQTSKPSAGFKPTTPAIKRPQTYPRHLRTYTIQGPPKNCTHILTDGISVSFSKVN